MEDFWAAPLLKKKNRAAAGCFLGGKIDIFRIGAAGRFEKKRRENRGKKKRGFFLGGKENLERKTGSQQGKFFWRKKKSGELN